MKRQQSSVTAEGIALIRGLESNRPEGERVCYDPWAHAFVNPLLYRIGRFFAGYGQWRSPGVYEFVIARCRYMDDSITAAVQAGAAQVVILGAGFDSRAYRLDGLKKCRVFEVDHPATQQLKMKRLKAVMGELPPYVTFVPLDLENQSLDTLLQYGYDPAVKTVSVWEGVTYYIDAASVDKTLAFVAHSSAAGSSIIFDYVYAEAIAGKLERHELASMQRYRRLTGEGIQFGIGKGQVGEFLANRGFEQVENADAQQLQRMYWTRNGKSRPVAPVYAIASARVRGASERE